MNEQQKVSKTGLYISKDVHRVSREQAIAERKLIEEFLASKPKDFCQIPIQKLGVNYDKSRFPACQGL